MELQELEYAARIILALCREHPELCPHDWSFNCSVGSWPNGEYEEGIRTITDRCNICGCNRQHEDPTPEPPRYQITGMKGDGTPIYPCPKCGESLYKDRCSWYYPTYNHICRNCGHEERIKDERYK